MARGRRSGLNRRKVGRKNAMLIWPYPHVSKAYRNSIAEEQANNKADQWQILGRQHGCRDWWEKPKLKNDDTQKAHIENSWKLVARYGVWHIRKESVSCVMCELIRWYAIKETLFTFLSVCKCPHPLVHMFLSSIFNPPLRRLSLLFRFCFVFLDFWL